MKFNDSFLKKGIVCMWQTLHLNVIYPTPPPACTFMEKRVEGISNGHNFHSYGVIVATTKNNNNNNNNNKLNILLSKIYREK